jgi:hypothetical protein
MNEYIKQLEEVRAGLVSKRRAHAHNTANKGSGMDSVGGLVETQAKIEVVDRAIADERALASSV